MRYIHVNPIKPIFLKSLLIAAMTAALAACGGGSDSDDAPDGGAITAPSDLSSYAGTYELRASDPSISALTITLNQSGVVTSCSGYQCQGSLSFSGGSQDPTLSITGTDGDAVVTIKATINSSGQVNGNWQSRSSTGSESGSLTGSRQSGGNNPPPSQNAAPGCAPLVGQWFHATAGTWTITDTTVKVETPSLNGDGAIQLTEMKLLSCESNTLQYKVTRVAVLNSAYGYDSSAPDTTYGINWDKVYADRYTLSGNTFTLGNFTYTKR